MKNKGLSLIEVTVAVAILALVFGGMLGVFWQGFNTGEESKRRTIAYSLAKEGLERKSTFSPWPPTSESRAGVSGFSGFEREVAVTCPYLGNNDLARIRITVWWNNGSRNQSFETLKANY